MMSRSKCDTTSPAPDLGAQAIGSVGKCCPAARHGARWLGALCLAGALAGGLANAAIAQDAEIDLDEVVRNPVIGNYRGYAEFKMAHYESARRIWEALAARGNGEAAFNLGLLHEDGLGVPPDMSKALGWYEAGAQAGSGKAQYRLGLLYASGGRVPANPERAQRWLTAAAAQGDADAARLLARLAGQATGHDPLHDAGMAHAAGDYARAAALYRALIDADPAPAAASATPAGAATGPGAASGPGAAQAAARRARTQLAWMYEAGQGVPRDLSRAAELFRHAAEAGDAEAQYAIAVMLQTGKGQALDPVEAAIWLRRSAAQAYAPAVAAAAALPGVGGKAVP